MSNNAAAAAVAAPKHAMSPADLDAQARAFIAQSNEWLQTHWLQILIAVGVGVVIFFLLHGARALGVGVHLKSARLAALAGRPLPWHHVVGASCHDASQLARAVTLGADFATLSPVTATASHPGAASLGWPAFQVLAEAAALPVYALGGMDSSMADEARSVGAQGVAGIGGFWPATAHL